MAARVDHYAVLGIGRHAAPDHIREAYHAQMMRHHPDHNAGREASAERATIAIGEAFRVLSNPARRAAYDAEGAYLLFQPRNVRRPAPAKVRQPAGKRAVKRKASRRLIIPVILGLTAVAAAVVGVALVRDTIDGTARISAAAKPIAAAVFDAPLSPSLGNLRRRSADESEHPFAAPRLPETRAAASTGDGDPDSPSGSGCSSDAPEEPDPRNGADSNGIFADARLRKRLFEARQPRESGCRAADSGLVFHAIGEAAPAQVATDDAK